MALSFARRERGKRGNIPVHPIPTSWPVSQLCDAVASPTSSPPNLRQPCATTNRKNTAYLRCTALIGACAGKSSQKRTSIAVARKRHQRVQDALPRPRPRRPPLTLRPISSGSYTRKPQKYAHKHQRQHHAIVGCFSSVLDNFDTPSYRVVVTRVLTELARRFMYAGDHKG